MTAEQPCSFTRRQSMPISRGPGSLLQPLLNPNECYSNVAVASVITATPVLFLRVSFQQHHTQASRRSVDCVASLHTRCILRNLRKLTLSISKISPETWNLHIILRASKMQPSGYTTLLHVFQILLAALCQEQPCYFFGDCCWLLPSA